MPSTIDSISSQLHRYENDFLHQKIDTICIKELDSFTLLGRRIGPFKVGHPYTLDQYIAHILVEAEFLKFSDDSHLSPKTIQKINFQESTNPELGKIPDPYIYTQAHSELEILDRLFSQNKVSRHEFTQLNSDVQDLIRVRLAKITRLAAQTGKTHLLKNLTNEEMLLFEDISIKIKEWREQLSQIKK
jgi:GINS complex protein helical bundle domain